MRVYIAGPYTKGDVALNVRAAIDASHELMNMGYAPFVPHFSHFQHMIHPREYEDWLTYDFVWVRQCEALVRLPGESADADREVELAKELGIPVFYSVQDFVESDMSGYK